MIEIEEGRHFTEEKSAGFALTVTLKLIIKTPEPSGFLSLNEAKSSLDGYPVIARNTRGF